MRMIAAKYGRDSYKIAKNVWTGTQEFTEKSSESIAKTEAYNSAKYEAFGVICDVGLAYVKRWQDMSTLQEEELSDDKMKQLNNEFGKTVVKRSISGFSAVGGGTAGAALGNLIPACPVVCSWAGGIVGDFMGRFLGSHAGEAVGEAIFDSDKE